ncbi:hypothetical protein BH18ACT15_BH18ACT15_02590 [soil metagenome]
MSPAVLSGAANGISSTGMGDRGGHAVHFPAALLEDQRVGGVRTAAPQTSPSAVAPTAGQERLEQRLGMVA